MENVEEEIKKLKTKWKIRRIINIYICFPFAIIVGLILLIMQPWHSKVGDIFVGVVFLLFACFFPLLHKKDKERYEKKINEFSDQKEQTNRSYHLM